MSPPKLQPAAVAAPTFASRVVQWQRRHGRSGLPWQADRDPYRVWLSEVMLQQTQVATVLRYYDLFLARFADVQALAAAPLDEVFAAWSGLGYYSRARLLHRCAQQVVAEHGGRFPPTSAALAQLPGIGRSTAAAIAAFCFGERVAILDGNVKRVLARVLAFDGDLATPAAQRALWDHATRLLPEPSADIAAYTQGLMDLGSMVCLARAPQCAVCPVAMRCVAAQTQTQDRYPKKGRRAARGRRHHIWLWLQRGAKIWLVQRPPRGIWPGLWSLPEFDSQAAFEAEAARWPGSGVALPTLEHALTHLDLVLEPRRWTLPMRGSAQVARELAERWPQGRWFTAGQALELGLPAPLRRLLSATS